MGALPHSTEVGKVGSFHFPEAGIGTQKADTAHRVGISATTKAQASWLPVQGSLHSSAIPQAEGQATQACVPRAGSPFVWTPLP